MGIFKFNKAHSVIRILTLCFDWYIIIYYCFFIGKLLKVNNVFTSDPGEGEDQAAFLFKVGVSKYCTYSISYTTNSSKMGKKTIITDRIIVYTFYIFLYGSCLYNPLKKLY